MDPLVSIVIPIYNSEPYIQRGVDCLTRQTYQNIEIILVDDCSTDNSFGILCDLAEKDPRITVLRQDVNRGAGAARNLGLQTSRGEYVTFFDIDDIMDETCIAENLEQAVAHHADLVMWKAEPVSSMDQIQKDTEPGKIQICSGKSAVRKRWVELKFGACKNIYISSPWNKLYRRGLILDNKLAFPDTRRMQDASFNVFVFDKVERFVFNPKVYYYYFFNSTEVFWKKLKPDFYKDVVFYSKTIFSALEKWGELEPVRNKVDHEFAGYLFTALEAVKNPAWQLPFRKKREYVKTVLSEPYIKERSEALADDEYEFRLFVKILKRGRAFPVLLYVYMRPLYYKIRWSVGRLVRRWRKK